MFLLSAHKVELDFHVNTIKEVTLDRPKNLLGLQRHLLILSVETLTVRFEDLQWNGGGPRGVDDVSMCFRQHNSSAFSFPSTTNFSFVVMIFFFQGTRLDIPLLAALSHRPRQDPLPK